MRITKTKSSLILTLIPTIIILIALYNTTNGKVFLKIDAPKTAAVGEIVNITVTGRYSVDMNNILDKSDFDMQLSLYKDDWKEGKSLFDKKIKEEKISLFRSMLDLDKSFTHSFPLKLEKNTKLFVRANIDDAGLNAVGETKTVRIRLNKTGCIRGVCCDDFKYKTKKDHCEGYVATEYGCPFGDIGKPVAFRYKQRLCSGKSVDCDGQLTSYTDWEIYQECGNDGMCVEGVPGCVSYAASDVIVTGSHAIVKDDNQNELVDSVKLDIGLLAKKGDYLLKNIFLKAKDGTIIEKIPEETLSLEENHTLTFEFDGTKIFNSRKKGPYYVQFDLDGTKYAEVKIQDYQYEHGILFTKEYEEIGLNPDADGFFSEYQVKLGIEILKPGTYKLKAYEKNGNIFEADIDENFNQNILDIKVNVSHKEEKDSIFDKFELIRDDIVLDTFLPTDGKAFPSNEIFSSLSIKSLLVDENTYGFKKDFFVKSNKKFDYKEHSDFILDKYDKAGMVKLKDTIYGYVFYDNPYKFALPKTSFVFKYNDGEIESISSNINGIVLNNNDIYVSECQGSCNLLSPISGIYKLKDNLEKDLIGYVDGKVTSMISFNDEIYIGTSRNKIYVLSSEISEIIDLEGKAIIRFAVSDVLYFTSTKDITNLYMLQNNKETLIGDTKQVYSIAYGNNLIYFGSSNGNLIAYDTLGKEFLDLGKVAIGAITALYYNDGLYIGDEFGNVLVHDLKFNLASSLFRYFKFSKTASKYSYEDKTLDDIKTTVDGFTLDNNYNTNFLDKSWQDLVNENTGLTQKMKIYLSAITDQQKEIADFREQRFLKEGNEIIINYVKTTKGAFIWRDNTMQKVDVGDSAIAVINEEGALLIFKVGDLIIAVKSSDYPLTLEIANTILNKIDPKVKKSKGAVVRETPSLCESYETTCPAKKAVMEKDISYCEEESFLPDKETCISMVAHYTQNTTLCNQLALKKKECLGAIN